MKGHLNLIQMHNGVFQLPAKSNSTGACKDSVKLSNLVNSLFKAAPAGGGATGDGGTLAACTHEVNGGALVSGSDHQERYRQVLRGVENLITRANNSNVVQGWHQLSDTDSKIG